MIELAFLVIFLETFRDHLDHAGIADLKMHKIYRYVYEK